MSVMRGRVTAMDAAGVFVRAAALGPDIVGPLEWVGTEPDVDQAVLVLNTGSDAAPDLVVLSATGDIDATYTYLAVGADYTVASGVDVVAATAACTITLPTATSGRTVTVKNRSAGTVVVAGTIDGETSQSLSPQDALTVCGTGSEWIIV